MELDSTLREELTAWLRVTLTPGLGPVRARALLRSCGLPQQVLAQDRQALDALIGAHRAQALLGNDPVRDAMVARTLAWAAAAHCHLVTLADAAYPAPLLEVADAPPVLYVEGDPAHLARPMVAIVGSRNATRGGCDTAARFAHALAEAGLTVVSGLARGIDAAAHVGAVGTCAGTIAVMATGIDRRYPPEHGQLAARIADHGALVTEAPLGADSLRARFPRRNRIIAGLARGVLVVEAARASGSLITARLAAEFGRDVFAIPGSIHSPLSKGCHRLIQQGAKLVESADDVLGELHWTPNSAHARAPRSRTDRPGPSDASDLPDSAATARSQPDLHDSVLSVLGFDPVHPDVLAARGSLSDNELAAQLLALELDGRIERLPDGRCLRRR